MLSESVPISGELILMFTSTNDNAKKITRISPEGVLGSSFS